MVGLLASCGNEIAEKVKVSTQKSQIEGGDVNIQYRTLSTCISAQYGPGLPNRVDY